MDEPAAAFACGRIRRGPVRRGGLLEPSDGLEPSTPSFAIFGARPRKRLEQVETGQRDGPDSPGFPHEGVTRPVTQLAVPTKGAPERRASVPRRRGRTPRSVVDVPTS